METMQMVLNQYQTFYPRTTTLPNIINKRSVMVRLLWNTSEVWFFETGYYYYYHHYHSFLLHSVFY